MNLVQKHQIREHDESGRLLRAGFSFVEIRPILTMVWACGAVVGVIGAFIAFFVGLFGTAAGWLWFLGFVGFVVFCFRRALKAQVTRRVIFERDGRTIYTHGVAAFGVQERAADLPHTMINSIEAASDPMNRNHMMIHALYSTGETLPLSYSQQREQDVRLAVRQLTEALAEIRAANRPQPARGGLSADTEW